MASIICDSQGGTADDILLLCVEKASHTVHTSMEGKHNIVTFLIPLLEWQKHHEASKFLLKLVSDQV